jgi:hypothetical protein
MKGNAYRFIAEVKTIHFYKCNIQLKLIGMN